MNARSLAGLVALTAVSTVFPTALADTAPAAAAEQAPTATALPPPGSWAVGYSAVTLSDSTGSSRLLLLNPNGAVVRTIAGSAEGWAADIQHDARRVITRQDVTGATRFRVYDAASGASKAFTLPGDAEAHFTDRGIVTHEHLANRLTLRDFTGRWLKTLPALRGGERIRVSPGGTLLMQELPTGVALRRVSDGRVVRTIQNPAGSGCTPLGLWGRGYVKVVCFKGTESNGWVRAASTTRTWATNVTPQNYWNAWPTSGRRTGETGGDSPELGSLAGSTFRTYFGPDQRHMGVGAHGSRVWALAIDDGWLKSKDVRSGKVVSLAGPGSALGGFVHSVAMIDTTG